MASDFPNSFSNTQSIFSRILVPFLSRAEKTLLINTHQYTVHWLESWLRETEMDMVDQWEAGAGIERHRKRER